MDRTQRTVIYPNLSTYVQLSKNTAGGIRPGMQPWPSSFRQIRIASGFSRVCIQNGGRDWIRTSDPALIKRML